ncbi:hypothetical protein RhiJN_17921 [Ceratobasidium sp. AG-Ba]|nr:hypothetical protein RhiJN_17921 [Ceratobasidium sp. AG-Ba]
MWKLDDVVGMPEVYKSVWCGTVPPQPVSQRSSNANWILFAIISTHYSASRLPHISTTVSTIVLLSAPSQLSMASALAHMQVESPAPACLPSPPPSKPPPPPVPHPQPCPAPNGASQGGHPIPPRPRTPPPPPPPRHDLAGGHELPLVPTTPPHESPNGQDAELASSLLGWTEAAGDPDKHFADLSGKHPPPPPPHTPPPPPPKGKSMCNAFDTAPWGLDSSSSIDYADLASNHESLPVPCAPPSHTSTVFDADSGNGKHDPPPVPHTPPPQSPKGRAAFELDASIVLAATMLFEAALMFVLTGDSYKGAFFYDAILVAPLFPSTV